MPAFDAYAMPSKAGRAVALRALVGLSGPDHESRLGWMHVAPEGEWRGHPDGPFSLTRDLFSSAISVFEGQRNPACIDYGHAATEPGEAPAAGWGQRLALREDGLWCEVEWTQRAAAAIRAGEYRYCSAVFLFDAPDRRTGERVPCQLHSIALTNVPFIDGQQPIRLTHSPLARRALSTGVRMKITREAFEAALEALEGAEFAPEQLHALVESAALAEQAKEAPKEDAPAAEMASDPEIEVEVAEEEMAASAALADAPPLPPVDAPAMESPAEMASADAGAMLLAKLTELTGLDAAAIMSALEANRDAIVAAISGGGGTAELAVSALSRSLADARVRLATYERREAEARTRAVNAEVDELVASGKVLPGDKDAISEWRALAHADLARFRSLSSKLPQVVPVGRAASGATPPKSAGDSLSSKPTINDADPKVVELRSRLERDWKLTDRAAQDRVIARMVTLSSAG